MILASFSLLALSASESDSEVLLTIDSGFAMPMDKSPG